MASGEELSPTRVALIQQGRRLEYFGIGWTTLEALIGLWSGLIAGSIALVGFGADSLIEIASAMIILWRLADRSLHKEREQIALKMVGCSFLLLAIYIGSEAIRDLVRREPPGTSLIGIVFSLACLVVMPWLARAKRRLARKLSSRAMHADSRQSDICAYLAAILLLGLALNAILGWWWADPVAALIMVPIIVKEGVEAFRGEACGCHG